jgi:hypothetical protein
MLDEPPAISRVTSNCLSRFALRVFLTRDCKIAVKLLAMAFNQDSGGGMSITHSKSLVGFDDVLSFEGERYRILVNGLQVDGYTDKDATSPMVCYVDVRLSLACCLGQSTVSSIKNDPERLPFYILNPPRELARDSPRTEGETFSAAYLSASESS